MNQYLIKTPAIVVERPPYALVDRVFVTAPDADEARRMAVEALRARGAEYIFACLIEGVNPADELVVMEHRMASSNDPFAVITDPSAFDLHAAAKANGYLSELRNTRRELARWKVGSVALTILLVGLLFVANYALGLKRENDAAEAELKGSSILMENNR